MKSIGSALLVVVFAAGIAWAEGPLTALTTDEEKLGYAMGMDLGTYLKGLGEPIHIDALLQGVEEAYAGKAALLSEEEALAVQQAFAERQRDRQVKEAVVTLQKNQKAGEEFLSANKAKEGVIVTESGLQYKVVKEGSGAHPAATDTVQVHYRGTLLDGSEFDSSHKRNQPVEFPVNQVIQGWQEALPLMTVGSTYELYIPSELAYGDRGAPPHIEPGSTLIFEVELLDIIDAEAAGPEAETAAEAESTEKTQ